MFKQLATEYAGLWEEANKQRMFLPERDNGNGAYGVPENKTEMLTSLATQFSALRARVEKDSKLAQKLETKLQVTTQGYLQRAKKLEKSVLGTFDLCAAKERELLCYQKLQLSERKDLADRVAKARKDAVEAEQAEAALQARYVRLTQKIQDIGGMGSNSATR